MGRAKIATATSSCETKEIWSQEERLLALEQQLLEIQGDGSRILRSIKGAVPLPLLLSVGVVRIRPDGEEQPPKPRTITSHDEHHGIPNGHTMITGIDTAINHNQPR